MKIGKKKCPTRRSRGARFSAPLNFTLEANMTRVFITISALTLLACSIFAEPQTWNFVQSVGGISIGTPFRNESGWILPVNADVSGFQPRTGTAINSGIACRNTANKIEGNAIYLTIITSVAGDGRVAQCPPAYLGQLSPGRYDVFYRGPNERAIKLGEVSIGL